MHTYVRQLRTALPKVDARTLRIVTTAAASYLGRFGQGLAVLITLPMARQSLHPELFGVWMMLSALLGFMAFADLGIGNGVLNNVTQARANDDTKLLHRTLLTGYGVTGAVGLLMFAAWQLWLHASSEPTALAGTISPLNRHAVNDALTVFAAVLAINIPASLILRVQLGMQQGYLNGINQLISALLTIAAVPLILHFGGSVAMLVLATLGVQTAVNIGNTLLWLARHRLLRVHDWREAIDMQTASALLRTGFLFFLLQLAAAFAFQSDAIVITQTLGQQAYGDFAVVQKLFLFISMLLSAAMTGLWPAFGDAIASRNLAWAIKALRRGMFAAATLATLGCAILALAMPWFMKHWLHSALQPAWTLVLALATWTVIDAIANVASAFMNGANILRAQLMFAVTMASLTFAAKWLLTPAFGAAGAVCSTILAYCLISVPGQIYIFKRTFQSKDSSREQI